jgi:hypothetical protein
VRCGGAVVIKAPGRVLHDEERLRNMLRQVEEYGMALTAFSLISALGGVAVVGKGELRLREVLHNEGRERKEPQLKIKAGMELAWEHTERLARR